MRDTNKHEEKLQGLRFRLWNVAGEEYMDKEEFMEIAQRRPQVEALSVYRLTEYYQHSGTAEGYLQDDETEEYYALLLKSYTYFSSFEEAERSIAEKVEFLKKYPNAASVQMILVERIALDRPGFPQPMEWRMYDKDGRLLDRSVYTATDHSTEPPYAYYYLGRKPEEIRFKPGDIVEVMGREDENSPTRVTLARVLSSPLTIEQVWEKKKELLDCEDDDDFDSNRDSLRRFYNPTLHDSYEIITQDKEIFVDSCMVFAPGQKIPSKALRELAHEVKQREDDLHVIKRMEQYMMEHLDERVTIPVRKTSNKRFGRFEKDTDKDINKCL
ncbi:MAG: hypothetical protein NC402_04685 [Prevotella sp.]|nr:hypothetical protein [Prevotella sp.]